ncbi:MAG: response regulator [Gammaproteobacteria bacterium]|nr:response regulator [Gammaproteobacteria bacterium]
MDNSIASVLVVDDEEFNLEILIEHLEDEGYTPVGAADGRQALALLESEPEKFDAVLLDRMMPEMDGMEVLKRVKAHPELNTLPVIMQTAKAAKENVLEGLQAGAHYYLTKPFDKDTMLAIVKTAVTDYQHHRSLQQEALRTAHTLSLMEQGRFHFRTINEARDLATLLANACPDGQRLVIGLSELFLNAVEHGNLGIGYAEKTQLNQRGEWEAELERRQALPENADKQVLVEYTRKNAVLNFLVKDQGDGFDWRDYLEISPERALDNHGRGIAIALGISFDSLEYRGKGNEVMAIVDVSKLVE